MLCIKNGRIHDAVHREPYTADILIENGKLLQIGTDLHAEQTIDAAGLDDLSRLCGRAQPYRSGRLR